MIKRFSLTALALIATIMSINADKRTDRVLMTIGNQPVTVGEFEYLFHKNNSQQQTAQSVDEYLGLFADYRRKVMAAEEARIDTTAAFLKDYNNYRRELARPYLHDKEYEDQLVQAEYQRILTNRDVSHIMLMNAPGVTMEEMRAKADSIHAKAVAGADFLQLAAQYSQDPNISRNHGRLGYLTPGLYPYEIDSAAWATPVGEVSGVFETQFGVHILKINGERPDPGTVTVRHILKLAQGTDMQLIESKRQQIDSLYRLVTSPGIDFAMIAANNTDERQGRTNGGLLPAFGAGRMVPDFEKAAFALADGEISKPVVTPYGFHIIKRESSAPVAPLDSLRPSIIERFKRDTRGQAIEFHIFERYRAEHPGTTLNNTAIREQMIADLAESNAEYSNLLREYRDGIMLFEISNTEVWNRANTNRDELQQYFEEHRDRYTWDRPHFKGWVIMSTSDSLAVEARTFLATQVLPNETPSQALRKKFGSQVRLEKVLAAKGDNPVVDHLAFGGPAPAPKGRFVVFSKWDGRIIDTPEEAADMRGAVSIDYQRDLEEAWLKSLREKYPVKIDKKVLKTVK